MQFTWDRLKAEANFKKHRVSFDEAATVFRDSLASILDDPDHSVGERREIIIGRVSFTERDDSKARYNRFASRFSEETVAVVLDPDVATVFHSSEAVNSFLRSAISAMPPSESRKRKRAS